MRATIARMKQLEYSLIKIKINVIFFSHFFVVPQRVL